MTRLHLTTCAAALTLALPAYAEETVRWWYEAATPDQQAIIEEMIAQPFEEAHPDYDLAVDFRGDTLDQQLRVAMLSGTGPDVVYTPGPSYVAPMAQAGQLMPLDDFAEEYGWTDEILPVFLEMGRYDGTLYALPKTYETLGLFYNKTLFEENGWEVPTTISELEALADEMLEQSMVPFSAGNADWRPANEHYVSLALNSIAGPEAVHQALTGEIPWTAEPIAEAVSKLNEWWERGYFGEDYFSLTSEQTVAELAQGDAGMLPSGTWQFQNLERFFEPAGAEPGFAGFPSADEGGEPVYALGVGSTFSINAGTGVAEGAAEVLDFVFTLDFYSRLNEAWKGEWNLPLTDLSGVETDEGLDPLYADAMADLASAVAEGNYGYTTWTFLPPATNSYLVNGMEEVWLDRITVKEFLAELDRQFQREREEGKVPAIPAR